MEVYARSFLYYKRIFNIKKEVIAIMMDYFYFLLSDEDYQDPLKRGFPYALAHRDEWIQCDLTEAYMTVGHIRGQDHIVYGGKVYNMERNYVVIDENYILFICPEAVTGIENKKFN